MAEAIGRSKKTISYYLHMIITLLLMFGFGLFPAPEPMTALGMKVIGIFLGLLYGWTTCGLIWPSLLGMIALALSGALSIKEVLIGGFGNETTLLILFLLIFAAAIEEAGVSRSIAMWFVTRPVFFGKPWLFTYFFLFAAFILSAATSTMAAIVICWSILYMVAKTLGYKPGDAYPALMVLGIVYACTLGLCLLPFKSVPLGLLGIYQQLSGEAIPFIKYVCFTAPTCLLSLLVFTLLGKFIFRPDTTPLKNLCASTYGDEAKIQIDHRQKVVIGFLVGMIVLLLIPSLLPKSWQLAQILNGIGPTGMVITIVAVMTMLRVNGEPLLAFGKMAARGIQWDVVILTAMVMPLVGVLTTDATGIKPFLLKLLSPVFGGHSTVVFCTIVALLAIVVTNLCNNGVTGVIFITITYSFAVQMGMATATVALLIIFCVHLALLTPAASPMAAMLHGNKEWISTAAIYKYGIIAVLITGVLLIAIGLPLANLLF